MEGRHYFNKKEKTIFWAAAMIALASGVIGNLFASSDIGNLVFNIGSILLKFNLCYI